MCASSECETQTTKTPTKKTQIIFGFTSTIGKKFKHLIIQFEFVMYALSVSIFERPSKNKKMPETKQ